MTLYLIAARIDEHGKISGGIEGDQNRREICAYKYANYRYGWEGVLRWEGSNLARVRNRLMCAAWRCAKNDNVGYDQNRRVTLYNLMQNKKWLLRHVLSLPRCSCDCSMLMGVCANIALLPLKLSDVVCPDYVYTGNMVPIFKRMGFTWIAKGIDFDSGFGLMPGDILLNQDHHTAMFMGAKKSGVRYNA